MNYLSLDVETSNRDRGSICQIGIAVFENGELVDTWSTLVDPEAHFEQRNIDTHKITPDQVEGAPTFCDIYEKLAGFIAGKTVIQYSNFDSSALNKACKNFDMPAIRCNWLDACKASKLVWEDLPNHKLNTVAEFLGFEFQHHDALQDAITAGRVFQRAHQKLGIPFDEWEYYLSVNEPAKKPAKPRFPKPVSRVAAIETAGKETIVFTGVLDTMSRDDAADMAAQSGHDVINSLTLKATLVVVGNQNPWSMAKGHTKSSKERKAEELMKKGHPIKIITEDEFIALCKADQAAAKPVKQMTVPAPKQKAQAKSAPVVPMNVDQPKKEGFFQRLWRKFG